MAAHLPLILEQHAEDAAILWLQRDRAVDAPHFNRLLLGRLEERLEAHLDGLRVAGPAGWETARAALEAYREPGEVFAAAVLALESRAAERIEAALAAAEAGPATTRAFVSALGWVGAPHLRGTVAGLLADPRPWRRMLGVAACSVHRVDPRGRLPALIADEAPPVRARALRLAGELGRADLRASVAAAIGAEDPCGFWAAWSAGLLGDRHAAVAALRGHVEGGGAFQEPALQLALRLMEPAAALAWLRALGRDPARRRLLAQAAGILCDPAFVPWLLRCMDDPALARTAGESFAMIVGVDLAYEDLDGDPPAGAAPDGPNDDPGDANVDPDPDQDLPWPHPERLRSWWAARAQDFPQGRRRLVGREPAGAALREILATGFQRQRRAAALELAARAPDSPLATWRGRTRPPE